MKKLSPVLMVEAIEPCLPFWVDRLGFELTAQVPEGDRLGFVILVRGGVELMLQSTESVAKDIPALASELGAAALFVEVDDLNAVERALGGVEPVIPRRTTFYGMDELVVRAPGGHVVIFAQHAGAPPV